MDSDDWSSDSDLDSDSDGSEDESDMLKGRAKWLKKTDDVSDNKKRKDEKRAAKAAEDGKKRKEKVTQALLLCFCGWMSGGGWKMVFVMSLSRRSCVTGMELRGKEHEGASAFCVWWDRVCWHCACVSLYC